MREEYKCLQSLKLSPHPLLLPWLYPHSHIPTTLCLPPSIPDYSPPRTAKDILQGEIRVISANPIWQCFHGRLGSVPLEPHWDWDFEYICLTCCRVASHVSHWKINHQPCCISKREALVMLQIYYVWPRLRNQGPQHEWWMKGRYHMTYVIYMSHLHFSFYPITHQRLRFHTTDRTMPTLHPYILFVAHIVLKTLILKNKYLLPACQYN